MLSRSIRLAALHGLVQQHRPCSVWYSCSQESIVAGFGRAAAHTSPAGRPGLEVTRASMSGLIHSSDTTIRHEQTVRVAVGQMTALGDHEHNFSTVSQLCQEAKSQACSMLFLPECFSFIGASQHETVAVMQPLEGPLMGRYRDLARQHSLWLSLGGFQETGPDPDHLYNCHVIISSEGEIKARYRKVHLFNVDVHNGPVLRESNSTAAGNEHLTSWRFCDHALWIEDVKLRAYLYRLLSLGRAAKLVVCDSPAGRLGVTICYDLRFPEVYQQLAFTMGAEVLLVPSAFTKLTGKAHWELLLRARAVETQCFVIAAAQAGVHNHKRESYGDSIIIDPWGDVIGRLDDPLATGIAVAVLDYNAMAKVQERMPIADHRRQGRISLGWDKPQDAAEAVFAPPADAKPS